MGLESARAPRGLAMAVSPLRTSNFVDLQRSLREAFRRGRRNVHASRVRSPEIYPVFSIGAPTLFPHSVHEPS